MNRVALVGGCRTPFVKAGGLFDSLSLLDLGLHVVAGAIKRLELDPAKIDELAFGTVLQDPRISNFAREIVLRSGLPSSIGGHSVSNNCISGLLSLSFIKDAIATGRIKVGLAGGSESMSRPTLTLRREAETFFLALARARTLGDRLKLLGRVRPNFFMPVPPSPKEPSTGLTMGQHCELMAKEYEIAREWQDQIALRSHQNGARAQAEGLLASEIEPLKGISEDNIIRKDTTIEKLAKLKPVFDRSEKGTLTAGNSSPLTDGASVVCLMAEEEAHRQNREILAYVEAVEFAAIAPGDGLLMAPVLAVPRLLERARLSINEIDLFEIHEAFGAQVAANLKVWEQGWNKMPALKPIGRIPDEKINQNGGSIAIGHPFAATGGRLALSLANQLKRKGLNRGVISVCAAGAMAGAVLLSRTRFAS